MNVLYIGTFSGPSGYAVAARGYFDLLASDPQINLKVINSTSGAYGEEPRNLKDYILRTENDVFEDYIVLYFIEPSYHYLEEASTEYSYQHDSKQAHKRPGINIKRILKNASFSLSVVAWEAKGVPSEWIDFISRYFNAVIVPSKFQNQNFSSQLKNIPVYTIPYVVKTSASPPVASSKFRILSSSQWSYRKGFDILIQAYLSEFFEQTDVELTIKTFGIESSRSALSEERNKIGREIQNYAVDCSRHQQFPKCQIKLWCGAVSSKAIDELYDNCDLFATTTRGEGFGLTIAEAINKGKRVLVPDKGGHTDYIHPNNYLVKSRVETMRCSTWSPSYSSEFKLIEPDFEDTRRKLREAYVEFNENQKTWKEKSQISNVFTKNYLSASRIKANLLNVLTSKRSKKHCAGRY
tara:strand:- start:865 stop:2091 length:1227 start_codon:yes stop_codon:yes gene_type:complete